MSLVLRKLISLLYQLKSDMYCVRHCICRVIIHIIRKDNSMKTTTNYLILNQASADLHRTLMESLHISSYLIGGRWFGGIVGLITCKIFLANLFIPTILTIWILPTIAFDRFYTVCRPFRPSSLSRHFKKIIMT